MVGFIKSRHEVLCLVRCMARWLAKASAGESVILHLDAHFTFISWMFFVTFVTPTSVPGYPLPLNS